MGDESPSPFLSLPQGGPLDRTLQSTLNEKLSINIGNNLDDEDRPLQLFNFYADRNEVLRKFRDANLLQTRRFSEEKWH